MQNGLVTYHSKSIQFWSSQNVIMHTEENPFIGEKSQH